MPRKVAITGASSGLGRALAVHYASSGFHLALTGRDAARLSDVKRTCVSMGAKVTSEVLDLRNRAAMAAWLTQVDDAEPIDLLIANAGILAGRLTGTEFETEDDALCCIETNVFGTFYTVLPVIASMRRRGRGQIALISSLAALSPLPDAPSYSASKAAILAYGTAMREVLKPFGVRMNVVCPGYVTTPMSARELGWHPFEISAEAAAVRIVRGLERDIPVISFPRFLAMFSRLGVIMPSWVRATVMRAFRFSVQRDQ